jgi:hypothetical protein
MAGLDPAIHDFLARSKNVDARVKPGHDGNWQLPRIKKAGRRPPSSKTHQHQIH